MFFVKKLTKEYAYQMKKNIKKNGLITTKENPAYGRYNKCINIIHSCGAKLGISRQDRLKLKLVEEKNRDDFDNDFMS